MRRKLLNLCFIFIVFALVSCVNMQLDNQAPALGFEEDPRTPGAGYVSYDTVEVYIGDEFVDPGYYCMDDYDETCDVVVTGSVDMTTEGSYQLTYSATDSNGKTSEISRTFIVTYKTHAERLKAEGKTISFSNLEYMQSDLTFLNPDYSDDSRTLWNRSSYSYHDVIVFPDPAFHELIRLELELDKDQDILFGYLQTITILRSYEHDIYNITSIEGIELLQNLDYLDVSNNINLASINGVQNLGRLTNLLVGYTSVKKIEYNIESLESLILLDSDIYFESSQEIIDAIEGFPNLFRVNMEYTNITIDDMSKIENRFLGIDNASFTVNMLDIDFSKIDLKVRRSVFRTKNYSLLDEDNSSFSSDYTKGINKVYESIGIEDEMNELTKIILIYDYVYETYKGNVNDRDGFTNLADVFYKGYAPTEKTTPYILNALLNKGGIDSEIQYNYYKIANLDTRERFFDDGFNCVTVKLDDGQTYQIDIIYAIEKARLGQAREYDRFLIGKATMDLSMYNEYLAGKNLSPEIEFFRVPEGMRYKINPGDVSRQEIIDNLPEGMTHSGNYVTNGCSNNSESVIIEEGVTHIEAYEYAGCKNLKSIIIPDSVTSIGDYAFYGCDNLESIIIPDSVISINFRAFYTAYMTIYVEADSKPDGWNYNWFDSGTSTVIWGYTVE